MALILVKRQRDVDNLIQRVATAYTFTHLLWHSRPASIIFRTRYEARSIAVSCSRSPLFQRCDASTNEIQSFLTQVQGRRWSSVDRSSVALAYVNDRNSSANNRGSIVERYAFHDGRTLGSRRFKVAADRFQGESGEVHSMILRWIGG